MKQIDMKSDFYFLLMLLEILVLFFFGYLVPDFFDLRNFMLIVVAFLILLFAYYNTLYEGLILSFGADIAYAVFIIYLAVSGKTMGFNFLSDYIWLAVFPALAYTGGKYGSILRKTEKDQRRLAQSSANLNVIDGTSQFNSATSFYRDLSEEMSRARRHDFNLAVMLIQIQYYNELLSIYGKDKVDKIQFEMAERVASVTRTEDKRYALEQGLYGVILPNTGDEGTQIVVDRLKKQLDVLSNSRSYDSEALNFSFRIGIRNYDKSINNPFEYREWVEKELNYDI